MPINQIYFSQHGLSLAKAENADRPLSTDGIQQTQDVANHLRTSSISVSCIFHSGKLRAQQTAEIFANTLMTPSPTKIPGMLPMDDSEKLIDNLNTDQALYVGHLPHLNKVISTLLAQKQNSPIVQFKNSGVVCLNKTDNTYSISWYLTPQISLA